MDNTIILILIATGMFAIIGGITVISHIYNLNEIKSKTVGDGQHGTARFANRGELRKTSVEWARQQAKDGKWVNKEISSVEVCEKLYNAMGWDKRCRYKVLGRVVNSPKGLILRFDLAEAIMFTGLPEEYVDPKTGELKKRHVSYYPDIYKGRIGRSYNDYIATQQLDLFEPLEGFTGKTYEDLPPEGSDETADTQTDATPVYQQHTLTGNGGQYE